MKLSFTIVLFSCLQVSAFTYAQKITLVKKQASLEDVFKAIRKQSGYNIFYNSEMLAGTSPVTLNVKNLDINEVMKKCLKGQNLNYNIVDKNIIISKPSQQDKAPVKATVVTGKITDDKNIPLPGVSIRVKGTQVSAVSDKDGNYRITVPGNDAILVFTSIGFVSQERKLTGGSVINVKLMQQVTGLNEVVVVGYGEVQRKDLTGAVATVKMADIERVPEVRVDQMLEGRIAGVDLISAGGDPGSGTTVRVRGTRSINADNEPLYVIDGMIDAGDLSDVNPSDIESIQVLKDASSTAIYGSRGANGVILITTKKGSPGKDVFNYRADMGFAELPRYLDMMNATEYAELQNENYYNNNPTGTNPPYPDAASLGEGTNWTKEITRRAPYQNHTLSVSGGNTGLRYYFSGNYANQQGIIKASGFERYQGRLNLDKTFSMKLKGGLRINYSNTATDNNKVDIGSNAGWWNSTLALPPVMNAYDAGGNFESWNPGWYAGGVINSPLALVESVKNITYRKVLWSNLFLEYQLLKNLKLRTAFSNTVSNANVNQYQPSTLPRREFLEQGGYAYKYANRYNGILSETTLSYAKSWRSTHNLNLLGGWTIQKKTFESQTQSGSGYMLDELEENNMQGAPSSKTFVRSDLWQSAMLSALGRLNYNYGRKYYVTLTGRADGASNFSANHKWAFFPSGAFKWAMLEEPWMQPLKRVLSEASVRLSYGVSGNQAIPAYGSLAKLTASSSGYILDGTIPVAYYPENIPNANLSWETSSQWNAGIDFKLANNKLSVTLDAYNTITKDLLLNVQLAQQVGYTSRLVNLGETQNTGLELLINSVNLQSLSGFKWSSYFTFSTNKNQVLSLGSLTRVTTEPNYSAPQYYMYAYEVGRPISGLYGVNYAGTWKSQQEITDWGGSKYVSIDSYYQPGRQRYIDANGDGVLSEADEVYLGQSDPKIYGGLGNTFKYKGFDLDIFFQYSWGAKMYNPLEFKQGTGYIGPNQFRYVVNRWTPDNPTSDIPKVNSQDFVATDRFVHDASYLRLATVRLGYNFSKKNMPVKALQNLGCYLTGSNLFLLTKYNGYDPDVSTNSSSTVRRKDDGAYPKNRTIALSVSLKF
ncbi:TonB-dependent receptor [Pedobacter sp. BS3]|uniref:TonB-dependent receptor n=1 Tax=Pedobacter sp. BS3 TaxID=2567937 RepID=UPI00165983B5|nr:TonB-dependent receptor [Pedobacter sp. BS3]